MSIPALPLLSPRFKLDRYELLCAIARGGMAEVWIARLQRKHGFEKLFAIKTILPQYAADASFQSMFLDEAKIASGITHPNVVQILDLGEQDNILYIVMDWVEGDSLAQLNRVATKRGEPIPRGIVLRILIDICAGLHAAHELRDRDGNLLGVVHRDVSPQNILIPTSTGSAKLIDFGVAKARDRIGGETSAGLMKGKVEFMAPESPMGLTVDRRVDVWAVGAILFKTFAGRAPYQAESEMGVLHRLISGAPADPVPENVPAPIARVIERALAHAADDRYATALELHDALEEAMKASNLVATPAMVASYAKEAFKERIDSRRRGLDSAIRSIDSAPRTIMSESTPAPITGSSAAFTTPPLTPPPASVAGESTGQPSAVSILPTQTSRRNRALVIGAAVLALIAIVAVVANVGTSHGDIAATKDAAPVSLAASLPSLPAASVASPVVQTVEIETPRATVTVPYTPAKPVYGGRVSLPIKPVKPLATPSVAVPTPTPPPAQTAPPAPTTPTRPDLGY